MGKFADQVRAFALKTEGLTERTTRLAILEVWTRLIIRSPVDTGRFRGAWTTSYDEIIRRTASQSELADGVLGPPEPPTFSARVVGRRYFISNNVPYARQIEEGSSQQAPAGVVAVTAIEWPAIVRKAVAAARQSPEVS